MDRFHKAMRRCDAEIFRQSIFRKKPSFPSARGVWDRFAFTVLETGIASRLSWFVARENSEDWGVNLGLTGGSPPFLIVPAVSECLNIAKSQRKVDRNWCSIVIDHCVAFRCGRR